MFNEKIEYRQLTEEELTKEYPEWTNLGAVSVDMEIKPELQAKYGTKEEGSAPPAVS